MHSFLVMRVSTGHAAAFGQARARSVRKGQGTGFRPDSQSQGGADESARPE